MHTPEAWKNAIKTAAAAFGKTVGKEQEASTLSRLSKCNDLAIPHVVKALQEEEKFPANLGLSILRAYGSWSLSHPQGEARRNSDCRLCHGGGTRARRPGRAETYYFACPMCDPDATVPKATIPKLMSDGWEIIRYQPSHEAKLFAQWVRKDGYKPIDCLRHLLTGGHLQAVGSGKKDHEGVQAA